MGDARKDAWMEEKRRSCGYFSVRVILQSPTRKCDKTSIRVGHTHVKPKLRHKVALNGIRAPRPLHRNT